MGWPSFLVFFMFLFINVLFLPISEGRTECDRSAVSFTLCEESTGDVNFKINIKDKQGNKVSVSFRGPATEAISKAKTLCANRNITQKNVKHVRVISDDELCFQALVVDTTIIIDQPTNFKESCEAKENVQPCKELRSQVQPVLICPQALTNLLEEEGVIKNKPIKEPGPRDFETPTYDISNDMRQASLVIADGLTTEFRTVVKNRVNYLKHANFGAMSKNLDSFASFLGALGPAFGIFGGITTIITTFLTPNPFDQMVKYLEKEFDEVHRRFSQIQNDIADLKRVVQSGSEVVAMAPKLEAIRYSLRRYEKMVNSLSKDPVCGANNLFDRREVKDFMEQYKVDRVEDRLLDLYGVEYGEVLEASSLLKPFMRAYCSTNPTKVQQFMDDISRYALAGSLTRFAFKSLEGHKNRGQNCDRPDEKEKEEWLMKLYKFLAKANAIKEAAANYGYGLQLDMKGDLDKLIYEEVRKAPTEWENGFPGLFDKVYDLIINKLYNINDWPEACMVNLKRDRVVIIEVAQLQPTATVYGSDFKPWALAYNTTNIGLEKVKFNIKHAGRGYEKKELTEKWYDADKLVSCWPAYKYRECIKPTWAPHYSSRDPPPKRETNDRIISFLFNPLSYLMKMLPVGFSNFPRPPTPTVVTNMFPISVYYTKKEYLRKSVGNDTEIVVGCFYDEAWDFTSCRAPTTTDPNRATWDREEYAAVIAEPE